jgi:mono/diheme cytochrome c family protein
MKSRSKQLAVLLLPVLLAAVGVVVWISSRGSAPQKLQEPPGKASPSIAYRSEKNIAWVVDPRVPGDNLPPLGRSLFDFLVMEKHDGKFDYAVPFPFTALMQRMEQHLRPPSGEPALKAVLIPLGRSLQRTAAAPEFFKYPRVVVTTDVEPADLPISAKASKSRLAQEENLSSILLKDRIYLGYQEKADIVEVISYNEAAGRFEFQLVKDYRSGGQPKVFYANRAVCIACHQNGGPIFSRQLWDETNANPKVAALLRAQSKDFYGIRVDRGVDVPYAIDNATDRANLFAVQQLLWREGCGGVEPDAVQCRAGLLTAALQYRLSGRQQFDSTSSDYRDQVAAPLAAYGSKRWPNGLAIGNPDLPNRDPLPGERLSADFVQAAVHTGNASMRQRLGDLAGVAAAFEPLRARPPLEVWPLSRPEDAARAVIGVAEFIAEPDIARLDAKLFGSAANADSVRRIYRAACAVKHTPLAALRKRIDFDCRSGNEPSLAIQGYLETEGQRLTRGSLDRLQFGRGETLTDMPLAASRTTTTNPSGGRALLIPQRGGRHVRGADGNAVEKIEFAWTGSSGTVDAIVVQDFAPVHKAIAAMVRDNFAGRFDGFAAQPFHRSVLIPELFTRLGLVTGRWCCVDDAGMPAPALEALPHANLAQTPAAPQEKGLRDFYRYCAQCHLTPERNPPNFLAGDAQQVSAQLAHCAPRIYVRLAMGRNDAEARAKTPMPPENALPGLGLSSEGWRDGAALAALSSYASDLLKVETGESPRLDQLLANGYERLRPCLAGPG